MKITNGARVQMKAVLKVSGGDVIESNTIEYVHGKGSMLAGLETRLEGLGKGDKKAGCIPANEAFGNPAHQVQKSIPRQEFPSDVPLDSGSEFMAKGENGQDVVLHVLDANPDVVQVEMRHPLAAKDIEFEVEILSVSDRMPPPMPGDVVTEISD